MTTKDVQNETVYSLLLAKYICTCHLNKIYLYYTDKQSNCLRTGNNNFLNVTTTRKILVEILIFDLANFHALILEIIILFSFLK